MTKPAAERFFAPIQASLPPRMMLPRIRRDGPGFPFNVPSLEYFYYCRAAIYALARLWRLADGEVLFPAYCCGLEIKALLAAGASPRFYPVHSGMRVDPAEIEALIGPETRAIYLIHYLGFPSPVEELAALCAERGLLLIEDCALSLFSCLGNKPLGSFGDASVFSIHKSIPIPAGGALLLKNGQTSGLSPRKKPSLRSTLSLAFSLLERYFQLRGIEWGPALLRTIVSLGQPVKRLSSEKTIEVYVEDFDPATAGLKISRLSHWVIEAQDPGVIVEGHRRNFLYLASNFGPVAKPVFDKLPTGVCPLFFPIKVSDSRVAMHRLWEHGVQAWSWWPEPHPALSGTLTPELDEMRRSVLVLPCHEDLMPETLDRMMGAVREVILAME